MADMIGDNGGVCDVIITSPDFTVIIRLVLWMTMRGRCKDTKKRGNDDKMYLFHVTTVELHRETFTII